MSDHLTNPIMTVVIIVLAAFLGYSLFWAIYIVASPVLLIFKRKRQSPVAVTYAPTCWVVIPAHDAGIDIAGCIDACKKSTGVVVEKIVVIADHCSDDTARVASEAGAAVFERNLGIRGKTFALDWFFEKCFKPLNSTYPCVITDATARVEPDALSKILQPINNGYDATIGRAKIIPGMHQWLHIGGSLSLTHRSMQNRCRSAFGLNPLVEGRLMAFSNTHLNLYQWRLARPPASLDFTSHPTEDWRHGLRLAQENIKVAYVEDAVVRTPLRMSASSGRTQARRWDSGRSKNARALGLPLLIEAVVSRRRTLLVASLDAVQPPQIKIIGLGVMLTVVGVILKLPLIALGGFLVVSAFVSYYSGLMHLYAECNTNLTFSGTIQWVIWRISTLFNIKNL